MWLLAVVLGVFFILSLVVGSAIGAKVLARFLWWFLGPGFCRLWACVSLPVLKRASEIRGSFLRLRKLKGDV